MGNGKKTQSDWECKGLSMSVCTSTRLPSTDWSQQGSAVCTTEKIEHTHFSCTRKLGPMICESIRLMTAGRLGRTCSSPAICRVTCTHEQASKHDHKYSM